MTKPTKEQIDGATGERLAELVAVHCMGWRKQKHNVGHAINGKDYWFNSGLYSVMPCKDWQPHLPTEKGKAQVIDLAEKYGISIDFHNGNKELNRIRNVWGKRFQGNWQIAVLRACLYSDIGEE